MKVAFFNKAGDCIGMAIYKDASTYTELPDILVWDSVYYIRRYRASMPTAQYDEATIGEPV